MLTAALVIQNCIVGEFKRNLDSSIRFITSAVNKGAGIVVFPEMNLTGYVTGQEIKDFSKSADNQLLKVFSQLARKHCIHILIGLAEKSSNKCIYATHLIFHPDETIEKYRKIHTSPFEQKFFTPGKDIVLFESNGLKCGIQLCYDAHFPELSLSMALKGADVIFIPHASPRGTSQEKLDSWTRHLRARAFDNGIYVAACNQTGDNQRGLLFPGLCLLIGPDGNIIYQSVDQDHTTIDDDNFTTHEEGIHLIDLDKKVLEHVRSHKMRYFLPNRRDDLFKF